MARLTIYLADHVARRARKAAKTSKLSVSKWVAQQVTASVNTAWPPEFLASAGHSQNFQMPLSCARLR